MSRGAASLPDKSVYCHQTSFLLGRPWLLSVKVSAPLFLNNLNVKDRAQVQQKVSLLFLWFNIKVTWRKSLRICFQDTDFGVFVVFFLNISLSCLDSIILLKKQGGRVAGHTGKDYTTEHSNPGTPVPHSWQLGDSPTGRFWLWGCLGLWSLRVVCGERAVK